MIIGIGMWPPPPVLALTGNEAPRPFRASASSTTPPFEPYLAFDGLTGTGWGGAAMPAFLKIDLGGFYSVAGVALYRQLLDNQSPRDFTIETSGDDVNYIVQRNIVGEAYGTVEISYPFPRVTIARFVRINITALNGASPTVPVILGARLF